MDFDWADETIHASYGKHWLQEILKARGQDPGAFDAIRERCGELVAEIVQSATDEEKAELRRVATHLMERAQGAE
jgi:hypothetical protein